MIDDQDDTLAGYVPAKPKRGLRVGRGGIGQGIEVEVGLDGTVREQVKPGPTRYALALRRQASNRARRALGKPTLPALGPGSCGDCEGWGVVGKTRQRCRACGGSGG